MRCFTDYDYVIVNDEFEPSVELLESIVLTERARLDVMREQAHRIIETFEHPHERNTT